MKNNNTQTASQNSKKPDPTSTKMQSSQFMKLFEDELKEIYWAENALIKTLPELIKNVTSEDLNILMTTHYEETKEHLIRLKNIFLLINVKAESKKCQAMERHLHKALYIMDSCETGSEYDNEIISALRKVEHYEIESYETLCQFAENLGLDNTVEILQSTLYEEMAAHEQLSELIITDIKIQILFEEEIEKDEYEKIQEDNFQYA